MTSAPQSEPRRRQDDDHMAGRWSADAAGQVRGRIKFEAFQHGVKVAGMLRDVPEHAFSEDGAAS
jgi:hypothetical protein